MGNPVLLRKAVLACFGVLCAIAVADARTTRTEIRRDGRPGILLSEPFGFGQNGYLVFKLSNVAVHNKGLDGYENLGFFLAQNVGDEIAEDPAFSSAVKDRCRFLRHPEYVRALTTFQTPGIRALVNAKPDADVTTPFVFSVDQSYLGNGGVDAIFFANCESNTLVSFDVEIEMFNVDWSGKKNYLSVGELELPSLYLVATLVFATGLGLWLYNLRMHSGNAHRIHHLMTALGAFKVLTLAAQCGMYHYVRVTGQPDGWNIAYYIFTLLRGVLLFTVIVLIGTGWSYMTPFLDKNNKRVLMVVVPLQVISEIAIIVMDEFTPAKRSWFEWRDIMHLMDIACCAAILFPIVWRIKHLREAAQTDGKAERSLRQLVIFKNFYILVLCYIYFTRIVVFILHATLPFQYVWLSNAAEELATLIFYTLTAMQFRPHEGAGYFQLLNDQDIEMGSL